MPRISHSSLIMLLVKLVPLSLRSLARAPKIEVKPPYGNLVTVFAVLIRGHIHQYIFSEMVLENQDMGNSR